ncbi:MAG: DUF5666 domain-containing protein [Elusimicrobia bacterium]|nr:DUF5666 domain-containing protein [Candidatus Obscuribacterium magneticum]
MKKLIVPVLSIVLGIGSILSAKAIPKRSSSASPAKQVSTKSAMPSHFSKVVGIVESIDTNQLVIKMRNGKSQTFTLDKNAQIEQGSKNIDISQIKQGERISVRFDKNTNGAKQIYLLSSIKHHAGK